MQKALIHNAQIYALRHNLQLVERLGHGVHGIVLVAEDKGDAQACCCMFPFGLPFQGELSPRVWSEGVALG